MQMIQECSKNINKLEFRHSAKKTAGGDKEDPQNESPSKPTTTKATICLVDLSKRDDEIDEDEVKLKIQPVE